MEIDTNNDVIALDLNPSILISNLLRDCNEVESLALLINHIAPKLNENTTVVFLHKIQLDIFKMLKDEYLTIATKPYSIAKNNCAEALDNIYEELQTRTFFRTYIDNPEIRRALINCLTLAALAHICQEHEKYTLGLEIYKTLTKISTFIFTHRPLPIEKSSYFQKNTATLMADYLWDKDVSNVLMPIHVARLVKRFTGLNQTPETIVKWLKEAGVIPKEVTQKIENGKMPKKKRDVEQQKFLYDSLYNEEYAAFLNSLKSKCIDR